ncbi:MAG: hypothetical protein D6754_01815 [Alphaproteobacteria bacterium]|nr:MAG: hypothetical protein D6754_01815 [Alphaproteobacteria bacterium]
MNSTITAIAAGLATALVVLGGPAARAETRVDAKADWSVFRSDNSPRECWIVSAPKSWTAKRGGRDVTNKVRRSDILLMVAIRPGENVKNEVSYTSGYPFRKGSKVKITVGSDSYEMFTEGEWGWLNSPAEDDSAVAKFKAGATAILTAVSRRGTTTRDVFSLRGFTAALKAARELCK